MERYFKVKMLTCLSWIPWALHR